MAYGGPYQRSMGEKNKTMMLKSSHTGFLETSALTAMLLLAMLGNAQAENRRIQRYEIQLGGGLSNFMGDICSPRSSSKMAWVLPQTIGPVGIVGFKYNLGHRDECGYSTIGSQTIGGSFFFGKLKAEEVEKNISKYYYRNGIGFDAFFVELSLRYEWFFIKEKSGGFSYNKGRPTMKRPTLMPSYLFVAAGGLFETGKFSWDNKEGRQSEKFSTIAPVLIGGIGTRLRINSGISIGLEAGARIALSDKIDNCDGKVATTPTKPWVFGKWIDQYQFITASLIFKLRENKNHLPDFRSIGK